MKHIKKKFLMSYNLKDDAYDYIINSEPNLQALKEIENNGLENYVAHAVTADKKFIQTFKYKLDNKLLLIPEPNPIIIYFSNAQGFLKLIEDTRKSALELLSNIDDTKDGVTKFYTFFGYVGNFITSLFNSLEAFINLQIPNDFKYERTSKRSTEIFNKEQIQRQISFEEKIKKVLPQAKGKSFHRNHGDKHDIIIRFEAFRNDIVHTKADIVNMSNYYERLYTQSLDFNYSQAINTVKDYINFYDENLIEACDCGEDY